MKKFTLMMLSDIHTASFFPSNNAVVTSIIADIERQKKEKPRVSKPDILVICGDIVEGTSKPEIGNGSRDIRKQYRKAGELLDLLCERLFDGEKNRIIVVPGNHDVSWPHSLKSMEKIENTRNLQKLVQVSESNYRWSWADNSYYKIKNPKMYNRRFELFAEFYSRLYEGNREYSLDPERQFDVFEYPDEEIIVAGFNSCFRNDHLNYVGSINSECIASCYDKINQKKYEDWIKIAAWHHDVQGNPVRSDFMDARVLQFLIDRGFQIALHGHTHQSDIFEVRFSADQKFRMNVFGCGTFGAKRDAIPLGESKQYAVLELNLSTGALRFNLRKALDQPPEMPIWMAGNIRQNRDKSFINGKMVGIKRAKTEIVYSLKDILEAEALISKGEYSLALEKLTRLDKNQPFVRRLMIECYWQLDENQKLIDIIVKPTSLIEFTYMTEALWRIKDFSLLRKILKEASKDNDIASTQVFKRMKAKLEDAEHE